MGDSRTLTAPQLKLTFREEDEVAVQNPEGGERSPWTYGKVLEVRGGNDPAPLTLVVAVRDSDKRLEVDPKEVTVVVLTGDGSGGL